MLLQLKDDPDSRCWIAAEITHLPEHFALGSGEAIGAYRNRPLQARVEYRVFVAAYKTDQQVLVATAIPRHAWTCMAHVPLWPRRLSRVVK